MTSRPTYRGLSEDPRRAFDQAHTQLMALASRLRQVARPAEGHQLIAGIESILHRHAEEEEEEGGVFDWLLSLAPEVAYEVGVLRDEHEVLRGKLVTIASSRGLDAKVQVALLHDFAATLRMHERHERAAMHAALIRQERRI